MTTRNTQIYSVLGIVATATLLMPEVAHAQSGTGASLFNDVQDLVQGNLGVVIGLALSLFGLWMWLVQQATWGLIIVVGGAALTAFPGIYGSLNQGIKNAFQDAQGDASVASGSGGYSGGTHPAER